jgi:hypothetical protein
MKYLAGNYVWKSRERRKFAHGLRNKFPSSKEEFLSSNTDREDAG